MQLDVEHVGDELAKEVPAVRLDTAPLDETQPVVQTPREDRISRAVRLELEQFRFEKEAKRDSDVPELDLQIEKLNDVAVFSGTSAWKRTNSW